MLHSQWGHRFQVTGKSKAVLAQVRVSDSQKSIFDLGSCSSPCKLPDFLLRTGAQEYPVGSPCTDDFQSITTMPADTVLVTRKKRLQWNQKRPQKCSVLKHPELKPRFNHNWLGLCAVTKSYALGNTERSLEILEKGCKMMKGSCLAPKTGKAKAK